MKNDRNKESDFLFPPAEQKSPNELLDGNVRFVWDWGHQSGLHGSSEPNFSSFWPLSWLLLALETGGTSRSKEGPGGARRCQLEPEGAGFL